MQIGCQDCEEPSCIGRSYPRSPPLDYHHWPACPEYLLGLPDVQYVLQLWQTKNMGPIHGYPWSVPCYISDTFGHIHAALNPPDKKG